MRWPQIVPVMTLPNAILFPQSLLPLYIFEPKYQAMLRDALDGDRMFVIALARCPCGNSPLAPHDVGGLGLIRACTDNPDGTSNLILQGLTRVRILEISSENPYRQARIEPIRSVNSSGIDVEALMLRVLEIAVAAASSIPGMPPQISEFLGKLDDPDTLCDVVSSTMVSDIQSRQRLLETADVRKRLNELIPCLTRASSRGGEKNGA
ncbi:MAG TPA: LON peptidase substrate-binding domain-containing protein [Verrucomicrobiae bacterium]|nr:LON peptidase substrate-binding domain-containing protein [Verrucomicrobiae bacterium]